jgi:hypothetical protein
MQLTPYKLKPRIVEAWKYKGNPSETLLSDERFVYDKKSGLSVKTPKGVIKAKVGDYIISSPKHELYVCDQEAFESNYVFAGR